MATKSTELTAFERQQMIATLQGLADSRDLGSLGKVGGCYTRDCAIASLEGDYLARARSIEAKLTQFPKVKAGALGQEFDQLYKYLTESLVKLRTGDYATPVLGAASKKETPGKMEERAYANYLRMAQIDALILSEAQKVGDTGVTLDPAVQNAIKSPGTELTPGAAAIAAANQPINWWLWGGVGAGVLALGAGLWAVARRMKAKQAAAPAPVGYLKGWSRGSRKSRSRR